MMCELCDARARKRAVDAVEDFKPAELRSKASSFTESGAFTPASDGGDTVIDGVATDAANKRQMITEDESPYALLLGTTDAFLPVLSDLIT